LPSDESIEGARGYEAINSVSGVNGGGPRLSVCLVGPGWRFTSGISYYTCRLANSMAADGYETSVILLRRLIPRLLYPGKQRVGLKRARMEYRRDVTVFDGVDWWGGSLLRALRFLRARRSKVLLLEWWTAATLHTFLVLGIAARLTGMRVVIELHELQDPGEAGLALARGYGHWGLRVLLRLAHGCIVHSKADWRLFESNYGPMNVRVALVPHGPYDQYRDVGQSDDPAVAALIDTVRSAPKDGGVVNLLFFGLIRPYKGLDDLLRVFNALPRKEAERLWLTVVGETWENTTEPARLIAASPHADRITFVNEYVPDEVVGAAFAHADVAVLPYRRSSSSGILHVAMSCGLPTVVTSVGGLPEAASGYAGAVFVPPDDLDSLKDGVMKAVALAGQKFPDPRSWHDTVAAVQLAAAVDQPGHPGGK
jgi:glycosyltransferase involved in cell wall biosynthesis